MKKSPVKKIISKPSLLPTFSPEFRYSRFIDNLHYNTQLFSRINFFYLSSSLFILAGFYHKIFWALAFSNMVLVSFIYLKGLKLAHGLNIERKHPLLGRENKEFEFQYSISNESNFAYDHLYFLEQFEGVQKGHFSIEWDNLPANTQVKVSKKVYLDAGMGIKNLKGLELKIKDELGLFSFTVSYPLESQIEVYPVIEESPKLKAAISLDAIDFGFYEIHKRGDSNLFIGTREYRHGDPVKHINWRLSKKSDKIIVNEFEKNTNTFVSIILELNLINQLGVGELSTWEKAKDLCLSLAMNELSKNNHVQILSHDFQIPFGTGKSQLACIEKHFTLHELKQSDKAEHWNKLADLPRRSQVYYLCPMISSVHLRDNFQQLIKLRSMGQNVVIFTFDPYAELIKQIKGDLRLGLMELERLAREEFKILEGKFRAYNIPLINLEVKKGSVLKKQMLEKAQSLVEKA